MTEFIPNLKFIETQIVGILKFLGAFLFFFLALRTYKNILAKHLSRLSKKTKLHLDDTLTESIQKISIVLYITTSLWLTTFFIQIPEKINQILFAAFLISLGIEAVKFTNRVLEGFWQEILLPKANSSEKPILELSLRIIKITLWIITFILVLQNLGYNLTTLIAGLGVGGIAVAFALQNILGDIFASFSIFFDKPFEVGDYIIVGENKGTVKRIGIKTTRVESLEGQEVVIPNKELTETVVHNYGRIKNRRVQFSLGIRYETPNEKLKKAKEIIKKALEEQPLLERIGWIHFKSFGDFALIFEIVYFLKTADYIEYLNIQENINFKIKEEFEKEGIEFAYPTQTIILEKAS